MARSLAKWFGEPISELKVRIPKNIPKYSEDRAINKMRAEITGKHAHKKTIPGFSLPDVFANLLDHGLLLFQQSKSPAFSVEEQAPKCRFIKLLQLSHFP
jgi:hypothetical protein